MAEAERAAVAQHFNSYADQTYADREARLAQEPEGMWYGYHHDHDAGKARECATHGDACEPGPAPADPDWDWEQLRVTDAELERRERSDPSHPRPVEMPACYYRDAVGQEQRNPFIAPSLASPSSSGKVSTRDNAAGTYMDENAGAWQRDGADVEDRQEVRRLNALAAQVIGRPWPSPATPVELLALNSAMKAHDWGEPTWVSYYWRDIEDPGKLFASRHRQSRVPATGKLQLTAKVDPRVARLLALASGSGGPQATADAGGSSSSAAVATTAGPRPRRASEPPRQLQRRDSQRDPEELRARREEARRQFEVLRAREEEAREHGTARAPAAGSAQADVCCICKEQQATMRFNTCEDKCQGRMCRECVARVQREKTIRNRCPACKTPFRSIRSDVVEIDPLERLLEATAAAGAHAAPAVTAEVVRVTPPAGPPGLANSKSWPGASPPVGSVGTEANVEMQDADGAATTSSTVSALGSQLTSTGLPRYLPPPPSKPVAASNHAAAATSSPDDVVRRWFGGDTGRTPHAAVSRRTVEHFQPAAGAGAGAMEISAQPAVPAQPQRQSGEVAHSGAWGTVELIWNGSRGMREVYANLTDGTRVYCGAHHQNHLAKKLAEEIYKALELGQPRIEALLEQLSNSPMKPNAGGDGEAPSMFAQLAAPPSAGPRPKGKTRFKEQEPPARHKSEGGKGKSAKTSDAFKRSRSRDVHVPRGQDDNLLSQLTPGLAMAAANDAELAHELADQMGMKHREFMELVQQQQARYESLSDEEDGEVSD